MPDLEVRLKKITYAEQDKALMQKLNHLFDKGVIDNNLYLKAKRMCGVL